MKQSYVLYIIIACHWIVGPLKPQSLSLPAARSISDNRPSLNAQRYGIVANQKAEAQAFGGYLPRLSVSHSSQYAQELSTNTSAHTLSLNGSQLIFNPIGPQFQTKLAELATQQTTFAYQASSQETKYQVAVEFLNCWLLEQKKESIDAITYYTDLLEKKNTHLHTLNIINRQTWAATVATIAQNRATVSNYYTNIYAARTKLANSMGYASANHLPQTLSFNSEKPFPDQKDLSYYIDLAYAHRPELKSNSTAQQQYSLIAQSNRQSYLPTISAHGSISRTFAGAVQERGVATSVGLSITWNFFDGLQHINAAQAADAQKLRTTFERQELKNSIALAITTIYQTITSNQATLVALEAQEKAAYEAGLEAYNKQSNGSLDETGYAKIYLHHAMTHYDVLAQKITLHTNWQTLAWYCGYPSSGVFDE